MWKNVACIFVTSNTLEKAPYCRERRQESEQAGAGRVALPRIIPMVGIQAKEQFYVLSSISVSFCPIMVQRRGPLTAIEYVKEQYMSPRKKSRNSTG